MLEINYSGSSLDLRELAALPKLAVLNLAGCRRQATLSGIGECRSLAELSLDDCGKIESLRPVSGTALTRLYLGGDTTILDGQLSFLRDLTSLRFADFIDSNHYDVRSRELPHLLG